MAVTLSATTATVKRSWADIVKGDAAASVPSETFEEVAPEEEASKRPLQPAARGKYQCHCLGEILVMLGHYGWIKSFEEIDHPDAGKNGGRIYVHKRDVKSDVKLVKGDVVSFYLYSDDQGLGAEYCQVQERQASEFRADAQEFVPNGDFGFSASWNPLATEFMPSSNGITTLFNPEAPEFDPSAFVSKNCFVSEFMPTTTQVKANSNLNVVAINPAFLSDDESDDDSSFHDADISDNGDKDSCFDESDQSSEHDAEPQSDDEVAIVHVPFIEKGSISDGSTSVGASSDSDMEDAMTHVGLPPGLEFFEKGSIPDGFTSVGGSSDSDMEDAMTYVGPPPGLELPAGFRPPPGLSL